MSARLKLTRQTRTALQAVHKALMEGKLPAPPGFVGTEELGITGTTNWFGDILAESNSKLLHELAYGQAGSRTWGEWEKILRTDEAVAKAVEFTKAQLRDARVDVEEAPESAMKDRALAKAQADFVRWNIMEALEPGWAELIQQQTEGLLIPGFVVHELVPAQAKHESLPGGSGYKLKKLAERLPVSIHVQNGWLEVNGELAAVRQMGQLRDGKGFDEVEIPANKLLLATWNRRGNNYLGYSPFRAVWYICKIREQLLKLIGISQVRESAGIPIAMPEKGVKLTKSQQKKLTNLLSNLVPHENASAVMPAGVKLEWLFSPGANKGHVVDAWRELGTAVLGQVQAQQMSLGTNNTGSRSVGEVHSAVADAFAQGIVAVLEAAWNGQGEGGRPYEGAIRKMIGWNWAEPPAAYPKLKLTLKQAKLPAQDYATTVKTLKDGGAITVWTREDENASREKVGLRAVTEEEWDEAKEQKEAAAKAMADALAKSETPSPKPGAPSGTPKPKPGEEDKTPAPKATRRASSAAYESWRPLRASELKLDLSGMAQFLDGQRGYFERMTMPMIAELLTRAVPDVRTALKDGRIDHEEIATLPLDFSRIEKFVGEFLLRARAEGWRHVFRELEHGKPRRAAEEEEDERQPRPTPPEPEGAPADLLDAERRRLLRKMEARLRDALEASAIDVARTNGSPEEVVADVLSDQVQSKVLQSEAGGVLTKAFNLGRGEFAEEYGSQVESVELSAVLDEGTCGPCESLDGTTFEFGSSEYERNTPPLRQCEGRSRCRCLYVFNFKGAGGFQTVDE
jgi:hypothetical protein